MPAPPTASSAGETDLDRLLSAMSPELDAGTFVFVSLQHSAAGRGLAEGVIAELNALAVFVEQEGISLVVPQELADAHALSYEGLYRCLKLGVHSSLAAVGLTAAVAGCLAAERISANVIAAYYHDYVFVPVAKADQAERALRRLSAATMDVDRGDP